MEIKVGQKWKHDEYNYIFEITNIVELEGRIYYEYFNIDDKTYAIIPKKSLIYVFNNYYTLIPPFRPHWLLDDGTKIYADETYCFGNHDKYSLYVPLEKDLYDIDKYCPFPCKNKECDFGILFNDGSHMWARWIGEENV